MATVKTSMQTRQNAPSHHSAAAVVAKLATVRATRPDLADWCERVPVAAELLCARPWESRWADLPDAALGTATLLAAWAALARAEAPLPAAFAALAEAQALAAQGVAAWPPASDHPELLARCLVGLSATPAAIVRAIALAGDRAALAAALEERAARVLDGAVLLANLPPTAYTTLLGAAAAAAHPALPDMLVAARAVGGTAPDQGAALVAALLPHNASAACELAEAIAAACPDHLGARLQLARAYSAAGNHASAAPLFAAALSELDRAGADCAAGLAAAEAALEHTAEARAAWVRALGRNPAHGRAAVGLARHARASGRAAYAERILAAAVARTQPAELPALLHMLHEAEFVAPLRMALERAAAALPDDPAVLYYAGVQHLRAGALAEAETPLARANLLAPRWPAPRVALADLLRAQGKTGQAAAAYRSVLDRVPDYAPALIGLCHLRAEQGNLATAIELAERLVRCAPEAAEHQALLADLLLAAGQPAEAVKAAQAAADRTSTPEHAARLARAHLAAGAAAQAIATLQSARATAGDHPALLPVLAASAEAAQNWELALEAWTAQFIQHRGAASARGAAQAARAAGKLAHARAWLARALRIDASDFTTWLAVAAIGRDTGRPQAAVRAYKRALQLGAPAGARRGLAQAYLQAGDAAAASTCLEHYLTATPHDPLAWHQLGRLRMQQGDRAGAIAAAERLADLPALPVPIACWMIDTLAAAGLRGRARSAADTAIAAAPGEAALRLRRAGLLLDVGALAEARADALAALTRQRDLAPARVILARVQLREAAYATARATLAPLADDPRHADVVAPLLAEALEGCGETVAALPYATRALHAAPADRSRRARLARLLLANSQPARVQALLQDAPDYPDLLIIRAQAAAAMGEHAAAQRDAQAATRRAPEDAAVALAAAALITTHLSPVAAQQHWTELARRFPSDNAIRQRAAQALLDTDQPAAAIALLRPLVERAAASPETAALMGRAYLRAGRAQDAVRTLRYAVRQAANTTMRAECRLELAQAYVALGWADDARATLDTLLTDAPAHAGARRARARLALEADDLTTAADDLAAATADDPEAGELRAKLAARQGEWEQAIAAQRHACSIAPSAERLSQLAELCAKAGDAPGQINALEQLTRLAPAPRDWAALAEAYMAAGNHPAARAAWQQALTPTAPAIWWSSYGRLLQAEGAEAEARAAFGRALARDPGNAASATALAELSDSAAERAELLRQATEHAPQDARLWHAFAQALEATGATADARAAFRRACALAPADPDVALGYANALIAAGERLAAVEVLEQACAAPDAPASLLGQLAAVLTDGLPFTGDLARLPAAPDPARQRLTARAATLLTQARERDPLTATWRLLATRLELVAGDHSGALALLGELAWDDLAAGERAAALALRAVALAAARDLNAAADDARQALDGPDAIAMHAILAEAAYAAGSMAEAYTHAQAARAAGADSPKLLATLGMAALSFGRAAEACEALELALEHGDEPTWLAALSRTYEQLDRRERAIEYAARAVRVAPNIAAYQHQLASLYQQQRRLHDARAALIRALSLQPDAAEWHAQMAEICEALGMAQAAEQSLARAQSLAPNDPAITVIGAQLRAAQGDTIGALGAYRQALAASPDRVEWHVAAAKLARAGRQAADFIKHAHTAVEHAPEQAEHWLLLAEAAEMNRDAQAAMGVLEEGLKHCRGDRALTLSAARRAHALGQPARAQALLDAWLDGAPEDAEAWELAGLAAQDLGDADAAQRALERAVRNAPRRASAHAALARLALATEDTATALKAAANASDYDPMNPGHVVLLARALQTAQRLDEARQVIRQLEPDALPADTEVYRWYAELQLLDGDPARAIAAMERAIEQLPNVPELHLWAGRAHRQLRHYRRAITHLRRAIRLRPSYPEAIIELSSLGPLAFAAHAARSEGGEEALSERVA